MSTQSALLAHSIVQVITGFLIYQHPGNVFHDYNRVPSNIDQFQRGIGSSLIGIGIIAALFARYRPNNLLYVTVFVLFSALSSTYFFVTGIVINVWIVVFNIALLIFFFVSLANQTKIYEYQTYELVKRTDGILLQIGLFVHAFSELGVGVLSFLNPDSFFPNFNQLTSRTQHSLVLTSITSFVQGIIGTVLLLSTKNDDIRPYTLGLMVYHVLVIVFAVYMQYDTFPAYIHTFTLIWLVFGLLTSTVKEQRVRK
jgi:hypothetical protein